MKGHSELRIKPSTDNEHTSLHRCPWWVQYLLASPLRRLGQSPEKVLGGLVQEGMCVVEPGCGFGFFSLPMAEMVGTSGKVVSVDVEARVAEKLRRRAQRAGLAERMEIRSCTTRDLGLGDFRGQVDLLVAIHMVHELEDRPSFFRQAFELLKPGGRMLLVEPKGHVTRELFEEETGECLQAGFVVDEDEERTSHRVVLIRT